jgi:hypothetical protein
MEAFLRALWCKQARIGDDRRIQSFVPVEALFRGRHFDGQVIILCQLVHEFLESLKDFVIKMMDGCVAKFGWPV